jgi:hypothetical protein
MVYRSRLGTKTNQEVVLAICPKREAFDEVLASVVYYNYKPDVYSSKSESKKEPQVLKSG